MLNPHFLGGEKGHRGFFGVKNSLKLKWLIVWLFFFCVLTISLKLIGIILAAFLLLALYVLTASVGRGNRITLWRSKYSWKKRYKKGLTSFRPVQRKPEGVELRPDELAAYRDWPEGAEGMYWLQETPQDPGIQWHYPAEEPPYLAVVWRVSGAIAGLESDDNVNLAAASFGKFLASTARPLSLIDGVQPVTIASKLDPAQHELWALENMSPDAPISLLESYDELVGICEATGMTQEHFIVVRWPLTTRFKRLAARRGPEQIGWIKLMEEEIRKTTRALRHAKLGKVEPLTAAQTCAVIRHQQMPSWPSRDIETVNTRAIGLAYDQEQRYVTTTDLGPNGNVEQWFHRTAEIPARSLMANKITALWLTPILTGLSEQIYRSISTHIYTYPASEARRATREDITLDKAEQLEKRRKGELADEEISVGHETALIRHRDLYPNTGIQGARWSMHITISAQSLEELKEAQNIISSGCAEAGIETLDWINNHHGAAQSWTWPIGRGMMKESNSFLDDAFNKLLQSEQDDEL
ncbi:hypothetical protein GZ176_11775 [Dermatophilus congolensis]|uniref:SCO6880 family protein n=1 Tax=Dermatophilus congolensis TaxID=1863 RepID=UPI001AAEDA52|nr:SCO6880 family protein [Dermatophilus congolensis]MBO3146361.1 hypothetical protein [Dermatophilus congolensis]MBO3148596.1 hypothetical protein [Dermatophilus congolensis]MBO3157598.1 hypothetical protein [Dermatophilus congolensis]MBO3159878.1 hypothetical protein [Dermatophilus congolensis]MBO3166617.1 hypothetical protein [Dermatophilus congolensis]